MRTNQYIRIHSPSLFVTLFDLRGVRFNILLKNGPTFATSLTAFIPFFQNSKLHTREKIDCVAISYFISKNYNIQ